jgi:hypothetical protein
MSELLNTMSFEDVILEGVYEALDAPPDSAPEFYAEECQPSPKKQKRHRHRKGENEKPTPLQMRYQRQVRDGRAHKPELVEAMSGMVAWTWIPGKDRQAFPPVVDVRDPRLLVMDRFPAEPRGFPKQIGLAMYRSHVTDQAVVTHGGPAVEMFKDFSIRPHFRAGGLCLDSRNEEVFRTALAMDQAIELVARGKFDAVKTFTPPRCLFGFPTHFQPRPEWRGPMHQEVIRKLQIGSPSLRYLLSPGGTVLGVQEGRDAFRTIVIEKEGNLIQIRVPNWLILADVVRQGGVTLEGQPLADLPRGNYSKIQDVTHRYPFKSLEWLERCIMDELTEIITVNEVVFDKRTDTRTPIQSTWRCVPTEFVQTQMGRAVRCFLDMRGHLGRKGYSIDPFERDVYSENPHEAQINVMRFDHRPTVKDLQFGDGADGDHKIWSADLLGTPDGAAWAPRCSQRGVGSV